MTFHSRRIFVDNCEFEVLWDKGVKQKHVLAACAIFGFKLATMKQWIGLVHVIPLSYHKSDSCWPIFTEVKFKAINLTNKYVGKK